MIFASVPPSFQQVLRCCAAPLPTLSSRKDLTTQVARLEAQLKRAGEGIEKEKADMEKLLLNLSNALSGVDVHITQSVVRFHQVTCWVEVGLGCGLCLAWSRMGSDRLLYVSRRASSGIRSCFYPRLQYV